MKWFVIWYSAKWVAVRGSQSKHPVSYQMELFLEPPYVSEGRTEYGPFNEGEARKFAEKMNQLDEPTKKPKPAVTVVSALERLVKACYPIDLWMGGLWKNPPSNDERHEFVLALSNATAIVGFEPVTEDEQRAIMEAARIVRERG